MLSPGKALALWLPDGRLSEMATYREAVLNWLLAAHDGVPLVVSSPAWVHEGLTWIGLDFRPGPAVLELSSPHRRIRSAALEEGGLSVLKVGPLEGDAGVTLMGLRQAGFIPEVILSALAQTGWQGQAKEFAGITRCELLVRFSPDGLLRQAMSFDLPQWQRLNRDRLHELTPSELLDLLRPFWRGPLPPRPELEAAILLHCEEVDDLVQLTEVVRQSCNKLGLEA